MAQFKVGDKVKLKDLSIDEVFSIVGYMSDGLNSAYTLESMSSAKKLTMIYEEEIKLYTPKPSAAVMNGITLQSLFELFDREQMVELEIRKGHSVREVIIEISNYPEYNLWRLQIVFSTEIINHHVLDKGDMRLATLKVYLYGKG